MIPILLLAALVLGSMSGKESLTPNKVLVISSAIEDIKCFENLGIKFLVIRGFLQFGRVDPNLRENIRKAYALAKQPMVYMIPCVRCDMLPEEQVKKVVAELSGVTFWGIIIKVMLTGGWGPDKGGNCEYIKAMIREIRKTTGAGIQTESAVWNTTMGTNCIINEGSINIFGVWEKHDGRDVFSDYIPFAGFTNVTRKEYAGPVTECGMSVDRYVVYISY